MDIKDMTDSQLIYAYAQCDKDIRQLYVQKKQIKEEMERRFKLAIEKAGR